MTKTNLPLGGIRISASIALDPLEAAFDIKNEDLCLSKLWAEAIHYMVLDKLFVMTIHRTTSQCMGDNIVRYQLEMKAQ